MSATADCRKTGCTATRGRCCKTAEGTGRKGGETRRNTHGSGVDPAGYGRKRMEQRITENMGRSLKEHGYLDPVFVGKGSFAKVYRVRDEKRDFQACKISKVTEQWEQECRNSREICHPLFPAYREHWTDGEWGYLVMEFWDGCDLRKMPGSEAGKYPHPRGWQSGDSGSGMSVEPGAGLVGSGKPKLQRSGAVRAVGDSRGRE